jgi:hypothetical protein
LWRRLVDDYGLDAEPHALRVLTLACEALDRCEEARQALARHGTTYLDRFGSPRARPEVAIERDSRIAAMRAFRELSLDADAPEPRIPRVGGGRS